MNQPRTDRAEQTAGGPWPAPLPAPIGVDSSPTLAPISSRPRIVVRPRSQAPDRQVPDAMALLKALRRRWIAALGLGVLLATTAAAATFALIPPSKYVSRALLGASSVQPRILFPTGEAKTDFYTYQKTQVALIKSHRVLKAALADANVRKLEVVKRQADPTLWLDRETQLEYSGEILKIWMSGNQPEDLPPLVNAVTNAYLREVVGVDLADRRKRYETLKVIYEGYQNKLLEERKVLEKLAEDLGSKDEQAVRLTQELALERRGLMEKELLTIELDLRRAEAELAARRPAPRAEAPPSEAPEEAISDFIERDKAIAEYKALRNRLQDNLARTRRVVRSGSDAAVKSLDQDLKSIEKSIAKRAEDLRASFRKDWKLRAAGGGPEADDALKGRIGILKELRRMAESDVKLFKAESKSINKSSMHLEVIRDKISHMEAISKRIGDEVEFLNVELDAPPRVVPMEMASAPRREADRRTVLAGMAGIGALFLAAAGVSFVEFRARRISSVEEVVGELEMRVMASLPEIPPRLRRSKRAAIASSSAAPRELALRDTMIESVDSLCANLIHLNRVDGTRVVMVTSAVGSEGKTSLSCALAQSLARAGRKALLIDADLRRPTVHRMFDCAPGPGLSEVLRDECGASDVAHEVAPGLWLMTAGDGDPRAIQALAHDRLGSLFGRLKQQFDYIVVDTPPILPVADALLIGQHVDAAICAILRDVSRFPRVRAAVERLQALEISILGAVVAGVRSDAYGSNDRYSYKSQDRG